MKREELNELRGKSVEELTAAITEKTRADEAAFCQGSGRRSVWHQGTHLASRHRSPAHPDR